jgi:hypothetical protein
MTLEAMITNADEAVRHAGMTAERYLIDAIDIGAGRALQAGLGRAT